MQPIYFEDKGMCIDGNYWLVHPQTGVSWTADSVADFIANYQGPDLTPDLDALKSAAVERIKQAAYGEIQAIDWRRQRAEDRLALANLGGIEEDIVAAEQVLQDELQLREAIRLASNEAEQQVSLLEDADSVEQFEWQYQA